jgi:hypothetical protein
VEYTPLLDLSALGDAPFRSVYARTYLEISVLVDFPVCTCIIHNSIGVSALIDCLFRRIQPSVGKRVLKDSLFSRIQPYIGDEHYERLSL